MVGKTIKAMFVIELCCASLANATLEENFVRDTLPDKYLQQTKALIEVPSVRIDLLKIQKYYGSTQGPLSYEFLQYIDDVLREEHISHKVPLTMMLALIDVESKFDHHRTSPVGAYGLCQLMPATAKSINKMYKRNLDLKDDYDNVRLSVIYLKDLFMRYKHVENVLRFYNGGVEWRKKPTTKTYYNTIMRKARALQQAIK